MCFFILFYFFLRESSQMTFLFFLPLVYKRRLTLLLLQIATRESYNESDTSPLPFRFTDSAELMGALTLEAPILDSQYRTLLILFIPSFLCVPVYHR